jgi:ribosomal protein S18 acetylase RimI-like enzyme
MTDRRSIQFSEVKADVDLYQLQALFNKGAFWAKDRQIEDLKIAIDRSEPVISVRDGDRLIGFGRATSDGIYRATIWDVVIDSDYQKLGLGRKLVETILSHPIVNRVERIYLNTTNKQSFYERLGFKQNTSTTMMFVGGAYPVEKRNEN